MSCVAFDPERCRQGVRNLKRDGFTPKKFSKICSEHFSPEFLNRTLDVIRLRENAVPTLFKAFPPRLQEEVARTLRKRKSPTMRYSSPPKKVKPSPGIEIDPSHFETTENVQLNHPYSLLSAQVIKERLQWQTIMISELADRSKKYKSLHLSKKINSDVK
nr:THAP domain-containing protein 1-like [Lepeophtheirus salmonis]